MYIELLIFQIGTKNKWFFLNILYNTDNHLNLITQADEH